ncbi:MAG TPA: NAD-dependent epimerase/dehydratase family protein [Longimicrobium sp.]|nr:NAD-dependent epimerase/dehydratase family protein [Longimicrobium sp.]
MKVIVTGAAGFIGSHLVDRLVGKGIDVVGIDNFDPFYDPAVKRRNLEGARASGRFTLAEADIRDTDALVAAVRAAGGEGADAIVHLAAKAGVRPSIADPGGYAAVNVGGTVQVLELARALGVRRFVFGSSSSVYGNTPRVPFTEDDPVAAPISPYAATKRAGELICHTYHHLHGLSVACLRFFTVYGPRQRPDLAIHAFARRMAADEPITLFGDGSSQRDYTFVSDIVDGIEGALAFTEGEAKFDVFNLGESQTVTLLRLVELLSAALGVEPRIEWKPPQPGDVERTFADVSKARRALGYAPRVPVEAGIPRFVEWLREEIAARRG